MRLIDVLDKILSYIEFRVRFSTSGLRVAMLHTYTVKNFASFRESTEVSFRITKKASTHGWDETSPTGQRLATALAVVGANGSGKTSLIKPLAFVGWFMSNSFQTLAPDALLPFSPHFSTPDEPAEFEIEADDRSGVLWRYVLRVTQKRVVHEALYRKNVGFSYVFVRDWDESTQQYAIKQQNFGLNPAEAKKVRQNASLISTAAQYGVEVAKRMTNIHMSTNLWVKGRMQAELSSEAASRFFLSEGALRAQMERLLQSWDLGLSGVVIRESEFSKSEGQKENESFRFPKQIATYGVHILKDGSRYEVPFAEESNGTQTAFVTLWRLLSVLTTGGVAVIDELENDMHPHMLEPLLDLFASPKTNPHQAQIIFTCHSAEVLNLLGKSQVVLVEKEHCESRAWRLDSMTGVRSQDNLYAKYLSGAYGAVPNL